jgi:hypothetical protein
MKIITIVLSLLLSYFSGFCQAKTSLQTDSKDTALKRKIAGIDAWVNAIDQHKNYPA